MLCDTSTKLRQEHRARYTENVKRTEAWDTVIRLERPQMPSLAFTVKTLDEEWWK
jgi:hypothetical protein